MFEFLSDPTAWAGLATLTLMEVVLGIDNIVFISIIAGKLPQDQQKKARILGLSLAAVSRLLLLLSISWIMQLDKPLIRGLFGYDFSGKDLILFGGGIFLVYKAVKEIHEKLEGDEEEEDGVTKKKITMTSVIMQIIMLDIIFSLDSVITAVGMTDEIGVMVAAMMVALAVMIIVGGRISDFIMKHPTVKMLALSFLLLIGFTLGAEGLHSIIKMEVNKGYIYAAMAFSVFVEFLNLLAKRRKEKKRRLALEPVHLRRNVVGLNLSDGE